MRYFYLILISAIFFGGCTSYEPDSAEVVTTGDNLYLEFNKWVYKEINRQYLWREDLPDSSMCDFDLAPRDFFESLLSPKDRFSYFTTNKNYNPQRSSRSIGFAYQPVRDINGNEAWEILYITSPRLRSLGFRRGDLVRAIHESDGTYAIHKVRLQDNIMTVDTESYCLSTSNSFESSTVLLDTVYQVEGRRVGYLCYLEYGDKSDLEQPLRRFSSEQITDLILDLRYNPGGYVSTCRFLCNCIVSETAYGKIFQQCTYNDVLSAEYFDKTGDRKTYTYFETPPQHIGENLGVLLTPLKLNRLYVITSSHTASASEATIICLRSYMPVTIIGEQTVGKGVGSWTISSPQFRYALQPITMRYYNADGVSTPDRGLTPDVYVPDGYKTGKLEIGDTKETLLNVALDCVMGQNHMPDDLCTLLKSETKLTPVGDPSYVTEFKNKHYNEIN